LILHGFKAGIRLAPASCRQLIFPDFRVFCQGLIQGLSYSVFKKNDMVYEWEGGKKKDGLKEAAAGRDSRLLFASGIPVAGTGLPGNRFFSCMVKPILTSDSCSCRMVCLNLGYLFKMRHGFLGVTFSMGQHGGLDLFKNPVGSRTSPAKCSAFCHFLAVVVYKLKFLNNSIDYIEGIL
jgi:hypothetical protein